jgi:hypothetical protein
LEIRSSVGFDQNEEIDSIRRRSILDVSATHHREWISERFWSELMLRTMSEGFSAAAFAGQTALTYRPIPGSTLRLRTFADIALQPLDGLALSSGAGARIDWPLALGKYRPSTWRVTPMLEFRGRWFSPYTQSLSGTSRDAYINSLVYRQYSLDHPLSLAPGARLDYLASRGMRTYLLLRPLLNSNLRSFDRVDAKIGADIIGDHPFYWNRWTSQTSIAYTLSSRLKDEHRDDFYFRHTLDAQGLWSWWWNETRRISLSTQASLFLQRDALPGLRLLVGLRLDLQTARDFRHYAPQDRLFSNELGRLWWSERPTSTLTP